VFEIQSKREKLQTQWEQTLWYFKLGKAKIFLVGIIDILVDRFCKVFMQCIKLRKRVLNIAGSSGGTEMLGSNMFLMLL